VSCQRRMLTEADREEISRGIAEDLEGTVIAERIGRSPSVVSREIARHGGRAGYRAVAARRAATGHRCRPKPRKLDADPQLREDVVTRLRAGYSPDQVAGRLRYEHPDQHARQVSHEAIYTWIYALPQGELQRHGILLRSGRTQRRPRTRASSPGARIVGMTSIDARPAEAGDRSVPGHWEGDLMIGKAGKSALGTLVERTSRYTVPVALPAGRHDHLQRPDHHRDRHALPAGQDPDLPTKAARWPNTPRSPWPPTSRCTSPTPTHPGNAAPTKTPTGCSASTSPKAPRSPTTKPTSTA
jgi:transposase, IS30 family